MNNIFNQIKSKLKTIRFDDKIPEIIQRVKSQPVIIFIFIAVILSVGYFFISSKPSPKDHSMKEIAFSEEEEMVGIKESVDPRDVWTSRVEQKVLDAESEFNQKLERIRADEGLELEKLKEELLELKSLIRAQKEEDDLSQNIKLTVNGDQGLALNESGEHKAEKSLGLFSREYSLAKRNYKEYITTGSFARGVLMTGVVVGTGSNSASNPEPIMLRLVDGGIFSKKLRTEQIKEAILIGDCSGDLSSERAKCRLQTLSLKNAKGEIIEREVKGWVVGEDGRNGVKGIVVDKASDMMRMAMLNGVLGGMSKFLQNQSSSGIFPISPITGQQNALSSVNMVKSGAAAGMGDAFSKMADFVMERFNSMSPQIVIASGRTVDVVFQHGVDLNDSSNESSTEFLSGQENNMGYQTISNDFGSNKSAMKSYQSPVSINKMDNLQNINEGRNRETF